MEGRKRVLKRVASGLLLNYVEGWFRVGSGRLAPVSQPFQGDPIAIPSKPAVQAVLNMDHTRGAQGL